MLKKWIAAILLAGTTALMGSAADLQTVPRQPVVPVNSSNNPVIAFVHTVHLGPTGNSDGRFGTVLDNPDVNGRRDAIVVITPQSPCPEGECAQHFVPAMDVFYDGRLSRWVVFQGTFGLSEGQQVNVIAVLP